MQPPEPPKTLYCLHDSLGRQSSSKKTQIQCVFAAEYIFLTELWVYHSIPLIHHNIMHHKAHILLNYVYISVVVLSWVYTLACPCRRSCLQVLYEFHLSAAWGTMWRISPNGLVCNCSVNTCLSRLGECGGKKGPSLQHTEATYWAANSYLPLDGGRQRGGPARLEELHGSFHTPRTSLLVGSSFLWTMPILSKKAEPVA